MLIAREANGGVNEPLSGSASVQEEITHNDPLLGPAIDHQGTPTHRPQHRPDPSPKPTDTPSGQPLECKLQNDANTHEEKEGAGGAKFDPAPESPQAQVVQDSGHGERAYTRTGFS
jgi:hypothetical protein